MKAGLRRQRVMTSIMCTLLAGCAPGGAGPGLTSSPVATLGPAAAIPFACAAAGSTVVTMSGGRRLRATANGPDPSDPTVCLQTNSAGRNFRILYGMFDLPFDGDQDARAALEATFAGSTSPKCFQQVSQVSSGGGINTKYIYEWCFKQAGQTLLDINGRSIPVTVFSASEEGKVDNYFAADWTYYYDPVQHIIVKGVVNTRRGTPPLDFTRSIG